MCTVTFVKSGDKYIITSNRDEKTTRPASYKPNLFTINNKKICFPQDPLAGGTWFAVDENANVAVLLNGAFQKHQQQKSYLKSRGLILLDILSHESVLDGWETIDLFNIEPFTLIVFTDSRLFQLRWDSFKKHCAEFDSGENHIWSSVTLYSEEISKQRELWFGQFQQQNKFPDELKMRDFHLNTQNNDNENGLLINRDNVVKTQSVTQAVIEKNKVSLFYHDILLAEEFSNSFIII